MDGKRLDLEAPLLSFRRITIRTAGEEVAPTSPPRMSLSFYNSDLKIGQVGIPGAVPFDWEKMPGQPKDNFLSTTTFEVNPAVPKLPPGRSLKESGTDWLKGASLPPESETIVGTPTPITCSLEGVRNEKAKVEDEEESYSTVCGDEDEAFSDARDAFLCAESFSMKCSMSAGAGAEDSLRSFTKDPQVKDFMMGRFLPAAQAMAEDSPQRTWRKPPRAQVDEGDNFGSQTIRRRRLPLYYQYQFSRAQLHANEQDEAEEEYDDDYGSDASSDFFSFKACGLIQRFFLKSFIGPLNPVPGLKAQGRRQPRTHRRTSPQINVLHHTSLGQAEDEDSWEAVYRYKLSRGYYPHMGDEIKLMTESNQLTSWSDSQMLDGSSFLNSTGCALSPDKHEDSKRESASWKTGSSDFYEKVYGSYLETTYGHGRLQGSGSTSPLTERPLNQNLLSLPETPDCKSVSANIPLEVEFQQTEESVVTETSEGNALQSRSSMIVEPGFSSYCGRLNGVEIYDNEFDNNENDDDGLTLKVDLLVKNDNSLALSLLPPPLPTSPSESWLQRTLPSVSSKVTHQQSFLGIQLHPKKQVSWASDGGHQSVTFEKPSNLHLR